MIILFALFLVLSNVKMGEGEGGGGRAHVLLSVQICTKAIRLQIRFNCSVLGANTVDFGYS